VRSDNDLDFGTWAWEGWKQKLGIWAGVCFGQDTSLFGGCLLSFYERFENFACLVL
jgi:hypothetical protein